MAAVFQEVATEAFAVNFLKDAVVNGVIKGSTGWTLSSCDNSDLTLLLHSQSQRIDPL